METIMNHLNFHASVTDTTFRNLLFEALQESFLKELRHDILSLFFDGLNYCYSVGKPKNSGLLKKKNSRWVILKQQGTRMAENGED